MIRGTAKQILAELPPGVTLVAAAKFAVVGRRVECHFISRPESDKAKKAVEIFDMIETADSPGLAREISRPRF